MKPRPFSPADDAEVLRYIEGELTAIAVARQTERHVGSIVGRARRLRARLNKPLIRRRPPWSPEEKAAIAAVLTSKPPYVPADFTLAGRTRKAIYEQALSQRISQGLGIQGRNPTRDRYIKLWHAEGHTCRRIATSLKVNPSTVLRAARRLGLSFARPVDCMHCPTGPIPEAPMERAA